jgi:hypothetical protein
MQRMWCVVALSLLTSAGCSRISGLFGSKSATPETPRAPATSKAALDGASKRPGGAEPARPAASETPPMPAWTPPAVHARGTIFGRLPKGTLLALRVPDVSRLAEAFRRTSLSSLLESPLFAPKRDELEKDLKQLKAELAPRVADLDALLAEFASLKGELVVALPSVDFLSLASGGARANGPSFTVAVIYQAGKSADSFQHLLDRAIELSKTRDGHGGLDAELPVAASGATTWMRRRKDDKSIVTLARDGERFTLTFTNAPSAVAATESLAELPLTESFNAADVVRATPDAAADGGKPVAEAYLNLAPVWSAVALALPAEAREPLASSGLSSIGGLSMSSALGKHGLDESLLLFSPGGKDLFSRFCAGKPLVSALASWLPDDATDTSLVTLDFAGLFDAIRGVLPVAARKPFDDELTLMRQQTGIDVRNDLFCNLGPNLAFATRGGLDSLATGGDFEWICAIELQDGSRMRRVLDRFFKQSGLDAAIKSETIEGFQAATTDLPPFTTPFGQEVHFTPAWLIDSHALVLATSDATLRKAARTLKEHGGPAALRAALASAGPDAFSVSVRGVADEAVTTVGRRVPAGLQVTSKESGGAMVTGALAWAASIGGAVALPKLLESRIASNETDAIETLRTVWDAEMKLRSSQVIDVDDDAHGEFGTLAELSGAVAPRGHERPTPFLDASFAPDARGVLARGGYLFRVDLPSKSGGGVSTLDPGAPSTVATDLAEQNFVCYAWPVDPPTTGARVFVIDASGAIFFTKNEGDQQHYCAAHAPPFEASQLRDPADKVKGVTMVRRGRDDGIWLQQH